MATSQKKKPEGQSPNNFARTIRDHNTKIAKAVHQVQGVPIRKVCRQLDANRTTLSRRLKGGLSHKEASQESQMLSPDQETHMTEAVASVFKSEAPSLGRFAYQKLAQSIIDKKFREEFSIKHNHPCESWETRLTKRNKKLMGFKRKLNQYSNANSDVYAVEFEKLHETLHSFKISMENTFSVGEMSLYDMRNSGTINNIGIGAAYREGFQDVYFDIENTILVPAPDVQGMLFEACNAKGNWLPSLVVFESTTGSVLETHTDDDSAVVPNWISSELSSNNDKAFLEWLHHFNRHTDDKSGSYRALYFAAHYYNLSIDVLDFAAKNRIVFLASPPNRPHMEPISAILEKMKSHLLELKPLANSCDIITAICCAKSQITQHEVFRAWTEVGLFESTDEQFKQKTLECSAMALHQYRRQYADSNHYYYGQNKAKPAELCKICKPNESRPLLNLMDFKHPEIFGPVEAILKQVLSKKLEERITVHGYCSNEELINFSRNVLMSYGKTRGLTGTATAKLVLDDFINTFAYLIIEECAKVDNGNELIACNEEYAKVANENELIACNEEPCSSSHQMPDNISVSELPINTNIWSSINVIPNDLISTVGISNLEHDASLSTDRASRSALEGVLDLMDLDALYKDLCSEISLIPTISNGERFDLDKLLEDHNVGTSEVNVQSLTTRDQSPNCCKVPNPEPPTISHNTSAVSIQGSTHRRHYSMSDGLDVNGNNPGHNTGFEVMFPDPNPGFDTSDMMSTYYEHRENELFFNNDMKCFETTLSTAYMTRK